MYKDVYAYHKNITFSIQMPCGMEVFLVLKEITICKQRKQFKSPSVTYTGSLYNIFTVCSQRKVRIFCPMRLR